MNRLEHQPRVTIDNVVMSDDDYNMRITQRDLDSMFGRVCRSAASMGIDTKAWYVQGGSANNGIAYRLYQGSQYGGVSGQIMPDGYLGMTKRQAYDTLHTMAQTMEYVNDHVDIDMGSRFHS
jgi:hypothetical protein